MDRLSDFILTYIMDDTVYNMEDRLMKCYMSGVLSEALKRVKETETGWTTSNIWYFCVTTAMQGVFGSDVTYTACFRKNRVEIYDADEIMFLDEKMEQFYQKTGFSIERAVID